MFLNVAMCYLLTYLLILVVMFSADNCTIIELSVYDGFKQKDLDSPVVQRDIANVTKMAILDIAGGFSINSFTVYFDNFAADYDDELYAMFFKLQMDLCAVTYDVYDTLLGIFRNRNEEIADAFARRWAARKGIAAEDMMVAMHLPIQFGIVLALYEISNFVLKKIDVEILYILRASHLQVACNLL